MHKSFFFVWVALLFALSSSPLLAELIELTPSKDNTLYEDVAGAASNGQGSGLFNGKTGVNDGFHLRRAVVAFDLSTIPRNALIDSVSVTFTINQVPPGSNSGIARLHRLQQDWGEGASEPLGLGGAGAPSTPGDATWIHRFFDNVFWDTPGGDFVAEESASANFATSNPETMTFSSTEQLVADVQSWLIDPSSNFGWILKGDESLNNNARRMSSREEMTDTKPLLSIVYTIPSVVDHLALTLITDELSDPVSMAHAGDDSGRLFIVEQRGVIRIYDLETDTLLPTPFLDIQGDVFSLDDGGGHNEQGLLGLAFHPDYATNDKFYVNYTISPSGGEWHSVVAEFLVSSNPDVAQPSGQVILQFQQENRNHNGGDLHFGPDGYLYIASGDGGGSNDQYDNAQNLDTLKGAILRIDVDGTAEPGAEICGVNADYGIPPGNPLQGSNDGCDEILHFGLRNPWRFSFDAMKADLWIADVGQNAWEEVNMLPPGTTEVNFGWSCREGAHDFGGSPCISAYTDPVIEYQHAQGNCSITGGYVYRGGRLPLQGRYLYGDWCSTRVWIATGSGDSWSSEEWTAASTVLNSLASFGQDENCNLYLVDRDAETGVEADHGALYRIDDSERVFGSGFENLQCQ